jgi:uncharacterized protein
MTALVTASLLYNLVSCPHRVTMDITGNAAERDAPNVFVELLWERGSLYEREVISRLTIPFVDLSAHSGDEKQRLTLEAMNRGEPFIYAGRITVGDLVGVPDILRREGSGYIAGDIKSGSGEEGPEDDSKPKAHYAVQLALYTDILEQLGMSAGRRAFVWDIHGDEVPYDFEAPQGKRDPRTLWQDYQEALQEARAIIGGKSTLPAASATCKLCHWYTACARKLKEADDLTMIPELGRSKRDAMIGSVRSVTELAHADPVALIDGKKSIFPGIGPDTLRKFHDRARLLSTKGAKPYRRAPIHLPPHDRELFFDIEVDPMRDICYLHGFVERTGRDNATEVFVSTFADDRRRRPKGRRSQRPGLTFSSAAHAPSITTRSMRGRSTASSLRNIPASARRTKSRISSTPSTRSTFTTTS